MDSGTSISFGSVGDPTMDAYHLVFLDMLRTIRVTQNEIDAEGVRHRISFLLEYAEMHFRSEEILMEAVGYPGLEAHKALHRDFTRRAQMMEDSFLQRPGAEMVGEILAFCESWFVEHIQSADQDYALHVRTCDRREKRRVLRRMWAAGRLGSRK